MIQFLKYSFRKIKKHKRFLLNFLLFFIIIAIFSVYLSNKFQIKINSKYSLVPQEEINTNINFNGRLIFNDYNNFEKPLTNEILEIINQTNKQILAAIYSIQNEEIISKLEEKRKEGIDISIVIPNTKNSQHEKAFKDTKINLIKVGKDREDIETVGNLMHHKFMIFDFGLENQKIILGSSNVTELQEQYDPTFTLISSDNELIKSYKKEFDLISDKKYGILKLRQNEYKPFSKRINYKNGFLEIWFGPGYGYNSIKYRMIDLIGGAKNKIEILAWQLNDRDIFNALSKKAKEGIEIVVLADDYYLWSDSSVLKDLFYLQKNINKNIKIVSDSYSSIYINEELAKEKDISLVKDFNSYLHHHTLIIDDSIVVTGTNNWGLNGFYSNDESVLVTNVDWFTREYNEYFDFLYKKIKGKDLKINKIENQTVFFEESLPEKSRIIFYIEKSSPNLVGEICFDKEIISFTKEIKIPHECITKTTRVFIINKDGNLISSTYL